MSLVVFFFAIFFIFLYHIEVLRADDDALEWCQRKMEDAQYVKTKSGGYVVGPGGRIQFLPDNLKIPSSAVYGVFDPSHKAILERSLGKEVVARAMRASDPFPIIKEAWDAAEETSSPTEHRLLIKGFLAMVDSIPRGVSLPPELKDMFFSILNTKGRIYPDHYTFVNQLINDSHTARADSLNILVKFAKLEIDLGAGDWEKLTVYGYSKGAVKPVDVIHFPAFYLVQQLLGESRAPTSQIKKGAIAIIKNSGNEDIELVENNQVSIIRNGSVISVVQKP